MKTINNFAYGALAAAMVAATTYGFVLNAKASIQNHKEMESPIIVLSLPEAEAVITQGTPSPRATVKTAVAIPDSATARKLVADKVTYKLGRAGYTNVQIAAVLGNLEQESGLSPMAVNPKSGAYGLMQWLGPRKRALSAFTTDYWKRRPGRDTKGWHAQLEVQTEFMVHEAQTTYKYQYSQLRTLTNLKHATHYYRRKIEAPGELEANDSHRYAAAKTYLADL